MHLSAHGANTAVQMTLHQLTQHSHTPASVTVRVSAGRFASDTLSIHHFRSGSDAEMGLVGEGGISSRPRVVRAAASE